MMKRQARNTEPSPRNPKAIAFAREQRERSNEFALDIWQMVRDRRCRGQKFGREYPIAPYTADFCCTSLKLIIEVDGESHQSAVGQCRDEARDRFLAEQGYQVRRLRLRGYEVLRDPASARRHFEQVIDHRLG
jgi:very-short-patch-repair endonuclease